MVAKIIYDDAGTVTDFEFMLVNEAAAEYFASAPDQLVGQRYRAVVPRVEETAFWPHLVRAAETDEPLRLTALPHANLRRGTNVVVDVRARRLGHVLSVTWRDVTEQSLLLDHYRLLAENASDAVFQLDVEMRITWASPSSEKVLGWAPDDLIGLSALDLLHPDERGRVDEWTATVERSNAAGFEARLLTRSGHYSYFAITIRPIEFDDGRVGLIGSIRNVDDEVANRESLRELGERYQLIAENSLDVVVVGDRDGRIQWAFDTVEQLLGWRPDELVGRHFDELVHPDDLADVRSKRASMLQGERITTEVRVRQADGTYRWIAITGRDVRDETGDFATRVVSWRDAEATVNHRRAIAESESQYRLLAENASDIVWRTSRDGVIEWVSPSVFDVLGWRPQELVGRPITDFNADDDVETRLAMRAQLLRGHAVVPFECRYRTADGGLRWMRTHYRALLDETGNVSAIVSASQDIAALVHGRRALNALAAGNAILVRAVNDVDLLTQLCQNLVNEGGYELAWYGRPVNDAGQSVRVIASSKEHREYVTPISVSWGDNELGQGPAGRSLRTGETFFVNDLAASATFSPWLEAAARHGFRSSIGLPVFVDGYLDGAFSVYAAETNAFDVATIATLEDLALQVGIGLQRLREQARLAQAVRESSLLNAAIDQAVESVLITDVAARLLYANPATTLTSGYSIDELIGETPALFSSGRHDRAFYEDLWNEISHGRSWHGVITNRRKSGELYDEDTTISPVTDDGGTIAYVAVKRDLSVERRLEAHVERGNRDAQDIANLMREVRSTPTIEGSALALCQALLRLDFVDAAAIFLRGANDDFVVSGSAGVTLDELEPGRVVDVRSPSAFLAQRRRRVVDRPRRTGRLRR